MQSETLAQEFARLVKEYHEGDDHTKPEAWNLLADYAVDNADAISAALSDKQAGEAKIKPLEWPNDSDWNIATSELGRYVVRPCLATNFSGQWLLMRAGAEDSDKTLYPSEDAAKAAAQADYEQRIRSALVDVPAVEVVAGYRRRLPQYAFEHYEFEQPGYESPSISDWETLYSHPPHREGEDSAEVIEELLRHLDRMQSNAIRAGELAWHPSSPIAESIEKVRALAATRSGSATTASGGDHG